MQWPAKRMDANFGHTRGGNSFTYSIARHHRIFRNHSSRAWSFRSFSRVSEYGYRDYGQRVARWASRDPIGENGGNNICGVAHNDLQNFFDPFGNDVSSLPPLGVGDNSQIVIDEAKVSCRACEIGKLCIRADSPKAPLLDQLNELATSRGMKGGRVPGHTFLLGVLRTQGGGEHREGVGFWPNNSQSQWAFFGGHQGEFKDDTGHGWTHQICFSMCPQTWAQIKNHESYRPIYNVGPSGFRVGFSSDFS
jgi:RHS repeat-associated protein